MLLWRPIAHIPLNFFPGFGLAKCRGSESHHAMKSHQWTVVDQSEQRAVRLIGPGGRVQAGVLSAGRDPETLGGYILNFPTDFQGLGDWLVKDDHAGESFHSIVPHWKRRSIRILRH